MNRRAEIPQEYLDALNEIVPQSSAIGAYAIGILTAAMLARIGTVPTKLMMQAISHCRRLEDVPEIVEMYISRVEAKQRTAAAREGGR